MQEQYVDVLVDTLKKKKKILERIVELNKQQANMLKDADLGPDELERNIDQKGAAIEELQSLDQGFERVFDRVKDELADNKDVYSVQIGELQTLIKECTNIGQTIESQEYRNKELMTNKFSFIRKQAKTVRSATRALSSYGTMKNFTTQYFDDKK